MYYFTKSNYFNLLKLQFITLFFQVAICQISCHVCLKFIFLGVCVRNEPKTLKTDVAEPTHNPIWNATFEVPNVPAESLMKMNIDISVWDYCPDRDSQFLGTCKNIYMYVHGADRIARRNFLLRM